MNSIIEGYQQMWSIIGVKVFLGLVAVAFCLLCYCAFDFYRRWKMCKQKDNGGVCLICGRVSWTRQQHLTHECVKRVLR